jgi:hypothetical protein
MRFASSPAISSLVPFFIFTFGLPINFFDIRSRVFCGILIITSPESVPPISTAISGSPFLA